MYCNFVEILQDEMNLKLDKKPRILNSGNNKRRRVRKPLWNDELTNKWNSVCQAEKQYYKCNTNNKSHLRHIFVVKRRDFDRLTQKVKRQFWHSSQDELIKLNDKDPRQFWKKNRENWYWL